MDRNAKFELALRIPPLDLIKVERVDTKFQYVINTSLFFQRYIKMHAIPDEFMWWVIVKGNQEWIWIVRQVYKGFFSDKCTSDRWLEKACQFDRVDCVEMILKDIKLNQKILRYQSIEAAGRFNLNLFMTLWPFVKPNQGFADIVMNKIYAFSREDQIPVVRAIFYKIFIYVSADYLNRSVFYLMRMPDLLKYIFSRIPVSDEHVVDVIYNIERPQVLGYIKMLFEFGRPKILTDSIRSALATENQEVFRFLQN